MYSSLRRSLQNPAWTTIASLPAAKWIALGVTIIVPGGFLVPLCYAAYGAIRRARAG